MSSRIKLNPLASKGVVWLGPCFWFNDPELQSNLDLAGQRLWQESFDSGMDGIVEELYWSAYARPPVFENGIIGSS